MNQNSKGDNAKGGNDDNNDQDTCSSQADNRGETGQESMPFSLQAELEKDNASSCDPSSLSRESISSSFRQGTKVSSPSFDAPSTSISAPAVSIHGSNNVVVLVQGSANRLDIQKALLAGRSRRVQEDENHHQDTTVTGDLDEADDGRPAQVLTLQTKDVALGIQLGEDLQKITAQGMCGIMKK